VRRDHVSNRCANGNRVIPSRFLRERGLERQKDGAEGHRKTVAAPEPEIFKAHYEFGRKRQQSAGLAALGRPIIHWVPPMLSHDACVCAQCAVRHLAGI